MKPIRFLSFAAVTAGLACSSFFTGCQSVVEPPKSTTAFYKDNVAAINGVSTAVNTVAIAIAPESPAVQKRVKELEAESEKLRAEMAKVKEDADHKNEELKGKIKDGLLDAAAETARVAAALTGTGPLGDKLARFITIDVSPALEAAKKVQQNLDATRAEIAAKEAQQKKDLEQALKEFSLLTEQQQATARVELLKLAQEKGIKGADGLTNEQLIAMLSAAGVGLAGLLRTFGASRAAPEIKEIATTQDNHDQQIQTATKNVDELWTDVKDLQAKVAVTEQRAAVPLSVAPVDSSLPQLRLEDHERRIGRLETKVG